MRLLRVRMDRQETCVGNLPDEWKYLGGSALIAKIMNAEVPPTADPLGPENHFIVAAGDSREERHRNRPLSRSGARSARRAD